MNGLFYKDLAKVVNNTGAFSLAEKRALRELAHASVPNEASIANQAHADLRAAAALYKTLVTQHGPYIQTRIFLDLTGLNSSAAANDVIGKNAATSSAAIFKWTLAECGTFLRCTMRCHETPVTGDTDIDLVMSATATDVEDAPVTGGTVIINSGGIAVGDTDTAAGFDTAKPYLYLVAGTGVSATYTAGIIEIFIEGIDLT